MNDFNKAVEAKEMDNNNWHSFGCMRRISVV